MVQLLALALAVLVAPATSSTRTPVEGIHEYAVIASPDVVVDRLSLSDLRRIFLLERGFWKAGQPIVVLLPPSGSRSRRYLLGRICGTDDGQLKRSYLEKLYRGEIDLAPKVVDSDQDAISFVSASRGLVAFVPAALVGSARVRVLAIGDRPRGSDSHPLKD
jgi:hypothetical protein